MARWGVALAVLVALLASPTATLAQNAGSGQNVTLVGSIATSAPVQAVALYGGYVYLAAGAAGLRIVDTRTSSEVASLSLPGEATDLAIQDSSYLFVAAGTAGLVVVDVADATKPRQVATYPTVGPARKLQLWREENGRLNAYVATTTGNRLQVVDVTDPPRPVAAPNDYSATASVDAVARDGKTLYLTEGQSLSLVDVDGFRKSDSAALPASGIDVATARGVAYVAAGAAGLRVIGVDFNKFGRPPRELSSYTANVPVSAVAIDGSYAYLAAGSGGLRVLDVGDPASPREVGFFDTTGDALDVAVVNHTIYLADGAGGVRILRYAGFPTSPIPRAYLPVVFKDTDWPGVGGPFQTSLIVQANGSIGANGATYDLHIVRADGSSVFDFNDRPLGVTGGDFLYLPSSIPGLTPGRYAVVASSIEPLTLRANLAGQSPAMATAAMGIPADQAAQTVYVPAVFRNYAGYSTRLTIQSAGGTIGTVTYRDQAGNAAGSERFSIANGGWNEVTVAVPDGFVGSARIEADGPVVAQAHTWSAAGELSAVSSVTTGATHIDLPAVYKNYSADRWISAVLIQNLDDAPADVRIAFNSSAPSGPAPRILTDTIPAHASRQYYQGSAPADLPDGFVGSATVESTNGKRLAAVVNTRNAAGHLDAYPGVPDPGRLTTELRFPDVYNDYSALHWTSSLVLKPTPDTAYVSYDITFYEYGRADPVLTLRGDYTGGGQTRVYYLPNVTVFGNPNRTLPKGFQGSAVVTFNYGGRIAGVANNLAVGQGGGDWLLAYPGTSALP